MSKVRSSNVLGSEADHLATRSPGAHGSGHVVRTAGILGQPDGVPSMEASFPRGPLTLRSIVCSPRRCRSRVRSGCSQRRQNGCRYRRRNGRSYRRQNGRSYRWRNGCNCRQRTTWDVYWLIVSFCRLDLVIPLRSRLVEDQRKPITTTWRIVSYESRRYWRAPLRGLEDAESPTC